MDSELSPEWIKKEREKERKKERKKEGRKEKKTCTHLTKSEIKDSKWQGNIVCQRLELGDETIDLSDCVDWSRN